MLYFLHHGHTLVYKTNMEVLSMYTFITCHCGEPLLQIDNNKLYKKNDISILDNNCYIQCPYCLSTSYFSKENFISFYTALKDGKI